MFTVLLCSQSHTLVWCPGATVGAIIHQYQFEFRYRLSPWTSACAATVGRKSQRKNRNTVWPCCQGKYLCMCTPSCSRNSQTRDQRRHARHGAGRNTVGKTRMEENEHLGENSVNRSGQPPFVLPASEKEQRQSVVPDKMTWQQHVGQAGKHFPVSPNETAWLWELNGGSHGAPLQLHDLRRSHPVNKHSTPPAAGSQSQEKR